MSKTSSHLPVCVHCGTARPADESLCPKCGKPWIDATIGSTTPMVAPVSDEPDTTESVSTDQESEDVEDTEELPLIPAAATAAATAAAVTPGADEINPSQGDSTDQATDPTIENVAPPPPLEDDFSFDDWTDAPPQKRRSAIAWLIPVVLAVAAAIVWVVVFIDNPSSSVTTTIAAAPTTTQAPTTTAAGVTGDTVAPPTTTQSEAAPPTFPPPSAWAPVGDALTASEFSMKAAGLGPLTFGMPIDEVAGLLGAGLGEAIAAGIDRVCAPDESYWLQWGDMMVIFDGSGPDAKFVSYRNEASEVSASALGFSTLSGLQVGDTVADLRATYPSYTISFERVDSTTYFNLFEGGDLLLWGPLTDPDPDGIVEGIYSPSPCPAT